MLKSAQSVFQSSMRRLLDTKRKLMPDFHFATLPVIGIGFKHFVAALQSDFAEDIQGSKMYLGEQDTFYLSLNKIYEPTETRFFQSQIRPGQVVLDIGANIGYYTLLFAKLVGPEGHVYAFEPEPRAFALLSKNVRINGYANVTLFNKSISDSPGVVRLFVSEDNSGDNSMYETSDARECIEVEAIRLDDYMTDFGIKIDFIKMDIQGSEYKAIQGMTRLLKANPEAVLVAEFEPFALRRSGVKPEAFAELIENLGFRLHYVDEEEESIKCIDTQQLLRKVPSTRGLHTNLVCCRGEAPRLNGTDLKTAELVSGRAGQYSP